MKREDVIWSDKNIGRKFMEKIIRWKTTLLIIKQHFKKFDRASDWLETMFKFPSLNKNIEMFVFAFRVSIT